MNWFRLKTCIKCHGDLAADNGDWLCLQCGTYYYTGLYQLHPNVDDRPQASDSNALNASDQPLQKLLGLAEAPPYPARTTINEAAMSAPVL